MLPIDLARAAGVSTQHVRTLEAAGVLPEAERSQTGYRQYTESIRAQHSPISSGQLARNLKVRSSTLRVWEDAGLLCPRRTGAQRHRLYTATDIRDARIIHLLRQSHYLFNRIRPIIEEIRNAGGTDALHSPLHQRRMTLSCCSVALTTLPVVARHHRDAVALWFDAHPDLNTPETSTSGYLGGLALSGALGWWDSGLGARLSEHNTILVGARDIDPQEQRLLDRPDLTLLAPGPNLTERLEEPIRGCPVYVHIDCDVLGSRSVSSKAARLR